MILLPDIFTTIRFLLVPFIYFSIPKSIILTLILLSIAFITDILDGYISRKLRINEREFGKAYDHLVDKLLIFVIIYALVIYKDLPSWALIFYLIREFLLLIGAIFLWFYKSRIHGSNIIGKISGIIFYVMVISYLFDVEFKFKLLIISIIASSLAFIVYAIRAYKTIYDTISHTKF
ncbi:MAG: CDP-alcohol phosphatidyltransferase family protein [candidate division WOR-3 bacterium]